MAAYENSGYTFKNPFSAKNLCSFINVETTSNKPILNKRIFWDVDFEKLNYETKASFIIERVFDRGDVEDIRQCRRFYGDEKIKVVLLNTKFLSLRRIHLASGIDETLNAFRCYRLRQLNPKLFPY